MGGTFDPIHYGHLYIAECARRKYNLEKILFVPSGQPVHKKRADILDAVHRMNMTKLAVQTNPFFELSTLEIDRGGLSFAVDTLEQLYRDSAGKEAYFFITGADAILEILTWKSVDRIFELCRFIAVTRPGYSLSVLDRVISGLTIEQRDRIYVYETGGMLVSSTDIRLRVNRGEPIKYLVPENVEEYIIENQLYLNHR
jgi:nicotinate-nucleotide adenylyltransferase